MLAGCRIRSATRRSAAQGSTSHTMWARIAGTWRGCVVFWPPYSFPSSCLSCPLPSAGWAAATAGRR